MMLFLKDIKQIRNAVGAEKTGGLLPVGKSGAH